MIGWTPILIVGMSIAFRPAHPDIVNRFMAQTCASPQGPVAYRLYVPTSASGFAMRPLVVWFHGGGEAGTDNCDQLAWLELVFGVGSNRSDVEAFVMAVQCAADSNCDAGAWHVRMDAALDDVIRRYAIDHDRVYLAGISHGANLAARYAVRHPGRFAAILALGTSAFGPHEDLKLSQLPIWVFQSTFDGPSQFCQLSRIVRACDQPAGNATLTQIDSVSHDCWTAALVRYRAWQWLMDQRRGHRARRFRQSLAGRYLSRRQAVSASGAVLALLVTMIVWRVARSGKIRFRLPSEADE